MNPSQQKLLSLCEQVRELDEKATKGPWRVNEGYRGSADWDRLAVEGGVTNSEYVVTSEQRIWQTKDGFRPRTRDDFELIAAYRTFAPIAARVLPSMIEALNAYADYVGEDHYPLREQARKALALIEEMEGR